MTKVQFLNIKSPVSFCKDFEVEYRIHSSIVKASNKHYIALCIDWSCKLLECREKTVLEQEGIRVKFREKGKVNFPKQDLQKLSSDGRDYYLLYRDEDGTILGRSQPFQFCNEFCTISSESTIIEESSTKGEDIDEDKLLTSSYTRTKNIPNSSPNLLQMENMWLQHATLKKEMISTPSIIRKYEQLKSLLLATSITLEYAVSLLSNTGMQDVKKLVESFTTQLQKLLVDFNALQGLPKDNREYEVLIKYYSEFCAIIRDVNEIAAYCVSKKIIPPQDVIKLHETKDPSIQVVILLNHITGPVQAGRPESFYSLLNIMEKHGLQATQELATEVKQSLASCGDDELEQLKEQLCNIQYRLMHCNLEQGTQKDASNAIQRIEQDLGELLEGTCYQASYDYEAQQDDEVSFIKGDIIIYPCFCDYHGWMVGCVVRTGLQGLFPLNHVQRIA